MRWVRPARLPVLVAWAMIFGVLGWLAANPHIVAPYASRMVSRHLLRMERGGMKVRDFRVRLFEGVDLYGVSLTLPDADGGLTLVSADTVTVDFKVGEALGTLPRMRRITVSRPELYSRAGRERREEPTEDNEQSLPRLSIDHIEVKDAYLEFSAADGRLVERISRLNWRGAVHSEHDVRLLMRGCNVVWDTHQSEMSGLRGEVLLDDEQIAVAGLTGRLNDHPVKLSGVRLWDGTLDIAVEGEGVSTAEVSNLIDIGLGFNAVGDLTGTFVKVGEQLTYQGIFNGNLEDYEVSNLVGQAVVDSVSVELSGLRGVINGASFEGGGHFDLSDVESVAFVLEGDVRDVDLENGLVPGEVELPPTDGAGHMRIEHVDMPNWTRVTGYLKDGYVSTIPFDSCYVEIEATEDSVRFDHLELVYRDLQALITGTVDSLEVFHGDINGVSDNLETVPEIWEWPALQGRLTGQGQLDGPIDGIGFAGWLSVYDFELDHVGARYSDVALVVDDVLGDPVFTAGIDGEGFVIGEVPLGNFLLWGSTSLARASIDSFRTALGDTVVSLSFEAAFSDTLNEFLIDHFAVDLEGTHWAVEEPVGFAIGDGLVRLPSVHLTSEQGAMGLNFLYAKDEVVAGSLQLQHFDMGLLDPFVGGEQPLTGSLTADVVIGGEPAKPVVNLTAELTGANFDLATIDSLEVSASYSQGTVDFQRLDLLSNYGRVAAEGRVSHPGAGVRDFWTGADLDLDLEIRQGDWAFLEQFRIPALDRLAGRFDGTLQVAGATDDPLLRGDLTSEPFNIHWLHLDRLEGEIWADAETFILGGLKGNKDDLALTGRIELPMDIDLMSEPETPLDGPFFMQIDIPENSNLEPLARATNAFVSSEGRGQAHVIVSGPLDHPSYQGDVRIDGAGFVMRNMEEIYQDASLRGRFSGDVLYMEEIRGREGLRGTFEGDGTVTFAGLELETFDLQLRLNRFLVASIPDLRAVISTENGRLTGVRVGPDTLLVPHFSGEVTVDKARYTGDFSNRGPSADMRLATVAPDWTADLHLHGPPRSVRLETREMSLSLGGDINLIRDESGLFPRGSLDVNSGDLVVFTAKFQVQNGRLDFSREVGFDPRIDLEAEAKYRLRGVGGSSSSVIEHIGVHVLGTLSQPEVSFTSERGYSREAIQRMLLGLDPQITPEGDSAALTATSINAGLNLVEREIAREVDLFDTIEIDQIRRQRVSGEQGLDPLIGVGKYIGSDLYLKYAQGIRQDDRDFIVEYQINHHMLVQSEVRRRIDENQGQPMYNLDLKYRFEY